MVTKGKCLLPFHRNIDIVRQELTLKEHFRWENWNCMFLGISEHYIAAQNAWFFLVWMSGEHSKERRNWQRVGEMFTGGWLLFTVVNIQAEWFGDTLHGWLVLLCYTFGQCPHPWVLPWSSVKTTTKRRYTKSAKHEMSFWHDKTH